MVVLTENCCWQPLFWCPRPLYYSLNHLQEKMGMSIELIDWLDSVLRLSAMFQPCNGGWTFKKWKNGKMESKSIYKIYMYISTLLLASVSNQNDGAVLIINHTLCLFEENLLLKGFRMRWCSVNEGKFYEV